MGYNTYITTERTDIMLQENLIMLRSIAGKTQEDIAEVIGISRQAYAKWERGETIPDIEKCACTEGQTYVGCCDSKRPRTDSYT